MNTSQPAKLLLSVEEAAALLDIGRTLTYALIRDGAIPSVQIGRLRRIKRTELETYVAQLGNPPATQAA